jgi:sensor c-di-GMP phosphodiesterase-like protein
VKKKPLKVVAITACLLIAGLPPLAFVRYLENHAVFSAEETLGDYAERMVDHLELTIDQGVLALTDLAASGAMNCDAAAIDAMRRAIFDTYVLREIAVVDDDGNKICADTIFKTERWTLSRQNTVNRAIDVSVVTDEQTFMRSLAVRYRPDKNRALIAHFAPNSLGVDVLSDSWRSAGIARLTLLDGTEFQTVPPRMGTDFAIGDDTIGATVVSNRYPLGVDIRVDRATVMRDYENLKAYALVAMSIFAGIVLGVAVFIARQRPSASDDISQGMKAGEFIPYYQPVINLSTGKLEGCEVLVRRRRRDGTIQSPAAFIAQAEADGQIIPLTRQLMRLTINELGESYAKRPHLSVAFNLCAHHFTNDEIVHDVETIFADAPIDPSQLVFEVTERLPLDDTMTAIRVISELQAIGSKVALDDAGTGHSGLALLHRLGMDIVKIDKLFIDPIGPGTETAPIVDSLVDLAKNLGMSLVAEGVETLDQVHYLRAHGVDSAQGYLFAPPLPASSYVALVKAMGSAPGKTEDHDQEIAA